MINQFGIFSGYKVNQSKSSILFLNEQERTHSTIQHPFTVSKEGLKYLGITITPQIENMIRCNYDPIVAVNIDEKIYNYNNI